MTYKLLFLKKSEKEWAKLDSSIKERFKETPRTLVNPKIPKDRLRGYDNVYKISCRTSGYRLAYEVKEEEMIVLVLNREKR